MSAEPQRRWTPEEYLAYERESDSRHEFFEGEIFAMSGASRAHNLICTNIVGTLHPQLKGKGCEKYAGDLRVRIPATGLYTYPDVTVVCDEPQFEDDTCDTLLNPTLIIEVLSPTTQDYDRGRKFAHYRRISSLQIYLLVEQEKAHVEMFTRQREGRWELWETGDLHSELELSAICARLSLADIYDDVPGIHEGVTQSAVPP